MRAVTGRLLLDVNGIYVTRRTRHLEHLLGTFFRSAPSPLEDIKPLTQCP